MARSGVAARLRIAVAAVSLAVLAVMVVCIILISSASWEIRSPPPDLADAWLRGSVAAFFISAMVLLLCALTNCVAAGLRRMPLLVLLWAISITATLAIMELLALGDWERRASDGSAGGFWRETDWP